MALRFAKMHGAGNDFVVIDCLAGDPVSDWSDFARRTLDRHRGVGGDQLLLVQPSREADFFMGIRNPDGSTAEMCANGIRAFLKYLRDHGLTESDSVRVETLAGVVTPRWLGHGVGLQRPPAAGRGDGLWRARRAGAAAPDARGDLERRAHPRLGELMALRYS